MAMTFLTISEIPLERKSVNYFEQWCWEPGLNQHKELCHISGNDMRITMNVHIECQSVPEGGAILYMGVLRNHDLK